MSLEGPPRGPNGKIKTGGIKGKSFPLNSVLHVRPPNNRPLRNRDKNRKFKAPKTSGPLMSSKDDKTNLFL